jgi:hypothetical protein
MPPSAEYDRWIERAIEIERDTLYAEPLGALLQGYGLLAIAAQLARIADALEVDADYWAVTRMPPNP